MKNQKILFTSLILLLLSCTSCQKVLDEKSNKKLVVPTTLTDMQSILDNDSKNVFNDPGEGEVSTTDYYLTDANYNALSVESNKRNYSWQKDYVFDPESNSWKYCYTSIYAANSVLDNINNIEQTPSNQREWNDIKGQALYLRAKNLFNVAVLWTSAYDEGAASNELGIPLRLNTDFNEPSVRSTIKETYDQILSDLSLAARLLPSQPVHKIRPSRPAAYGLLSRTCLAMRRYKEAGLYADSCLQLFNTLLDYNKLSTSAAYPIAAFNAETIIYSVIGTPAPLNPSRAKIDPALYSQYAANDLRRNIFFKTNTDGTIAFKGNYTGQLAPFGGISANEIYLNRAESRVRQGQRAEALNDLNTLLKTRWRDGTYVPQITNTDSELLDLILKERRKELLLRGLRWIDIKRLNKEGFQITLTRTINGQTLTLPPNDLRYALPIPEDVIALTGMTQNPR